jgi:hypothetical protein
MKIVSTKRAPLGATALACLLLPTLACSGGGRPKETGDTDTDSGINPTSSATGSSGSASGGSTFGSTAGSGSSTGDVLNCEYIDFVFMVDNSSSMGNEQQNLVDSIPGFIDAMRTALPLVKNFRVGIVDSDSFPATGDVDDPLDGCPMATDCSACDYTLGAFVSTEASAEDPSLSCNFSTGKRYMDGDSPAFSSEFECAALVGVGGNSVEQQVGALVESVSPEQLGAGGCNEGFIRDEALFVFLLISDEEDDRTLPPMPRGGSLGDPDRWHDAMVEVKGGKETNLVALGLIGGSPKFADCPNLMGTEGAEDSPRLQTFLESFETNFVGNVCASGYDVFFDEALKKVAEGCMKFIP